MKIYFPLIVAMITTLFLTVSCADGSSLDKSERAYESYETDVEESLEMEILPKNEIDQQGDDNAFISSSAAAVSDDTLRKLIRTANMKFRVENVRDASLKIENII
jgi:hypothetical protein